MYGGLLFHFKFETGFLVWTHQANTKEQPHVDMGILELSVLQQIRMLRTACQVKELLSAMTHFKREREKKLTKKFFASEIKLL